MPVFRKFGGVSVEKVHVDSADLPQGGLTDPVEVTGNVTASDTVQGDTVKSVALADIGGLWKLPTHYITAGIYTAGTNDELLVIAGGTGPYTVNLPAAPAEGDTFVIKRAASNTITIDGDGNTIDGSATVALSLAYAHRWICYNADEGEWLTISNNP